MSQTDPEWYKRKVNLDSKRKILERESRKSFKKGNKEEAQKYAKEADSLKFCKNDKPIDSTQQISGVVPVRVVRRKKTDY